MKMQEIVLSKFHKTPSPFSGSQPYCIAFVYSETGNFIVKGMSQAVETYIAQRHPRSFYRYTFWKDKESRGGWRFPRGVKLYIKEEIIGNRRKYIFSGYDKNGVYQELLTVRKIPKKWLPIFNEAS